MLTIEPDEADEKKRLKRYRLEISSYYLIGFPYDCDQDDELDFVSEQELAELQAECLPALVDGSESEEDSVLPSSEECSFTTQSEVKNSDLTTSDSVLDMTPAPSILESSSHQGSSLTLPADLFDGPETPPLAPKLKPVEPSALTSLTRTIAFSGGFLLMFYTIPWIRWLPYLTSWIIGKSLTFLLYSIVSLILGGILALLYPDIQLGFEALSNHRSYPHLQALFFLTLSVSASLYIIPLFFKVLHVFTVQMMVFGSTVVFSLLIYMSAILILASVWLAYTLTHDMASRLYSLFVTGTVEIEPKVIQEPRRRKLHYTERPYVYRN